MARKSSKNQQKKLSEKQIAENKISIIKDEFFEHKLFKRFRTHLDFKVAELPRNTNYCGYVSQYGTITHSSFNITDPTTFAHLSLHLAFGDLDALEDKRIIPEIWNRACCYCVSLFMTKLNIFNINVKDHGIGTDPEKVYRRLLGDDTLNIRFQDYGVNHDRPDMVTGALPQRWNYQKPNWQEIFSKGLIEDATNALEIAAGAEPDKISKKTPGQLAKQWFMASFPLLGSTVAVFDVIEDQRLLQANQIELAAVEPHQQVIYINTQHLDEQQTRFVMAHEILHVALRDGPRQEHRDAYLWNVACDYRINAWLLEMGVGALPTKDVLYDPELKGLSAEAIYERIVGDIRLYKKLGTLRGKGLGDILPPSKGFWDSRAGTSLDEFYRSLLGQGYDFHQQSGRGLLPASLIDEVRAALMPPIPWDVRLARWFDENIRELEKRRTYTRRSRRQAATPDIPIPAYYTPPEARESHTFGIIFDTSASMSKHLIAKGLGTIVAYAQSKDVRQVRLVYCDAQPYDDGYIAIDDLLGRVKVKGRGGTVLQPAVNLVEGLKDFPRDAPILIITDGWIDTLSIKRIHAYLLPKGQRLPFKTAGEVFYVE